VGGWEQLLPHLRARDWLIDRRVELAIGARRLAGTAAGLDGDGALLVRGEEGVVPVASGSVVAVDV
jgi:biotin-(acetyl-CoA carboxylase) ligase